MRDPYVVLGVAKTATQDEIKKAYRALAKKLHPDVNPGNKEAEKKFKEISEAYELVGTAEAREKFARAGEEEAAFARARAQGGARGSPFGGMGDGADFGAADFFENLMRQAGASGSRGRRARPKSYPGEDQLYQMEVDFRDAALGAVRQITLPNGKTLQVKVPAGIEAGAKLRFKGQGGPGVGGAPAGDAYVEISVRPLPGFARRGDTIEVELPVSFQEAILGAEVKVPTLDGQVMLKIPAGVSTGSKLRVRGKGVGTETKRGDQIVILKVVTPKTPNADLQAAIRSWEGKFDYDPR